MVLKETDNNNYIVLIEKYLETTRFDGLVVETSKRIIILWYRIQWVQPKITSYDTCLCSMCQISVTNGVFSTPHGPLILIKLMSICNLTPLISVCWQQLLDVMLWSLIWIFSLYQICSVAVNYRYRRYKSIWKFRSIIDMDFSISIYRVSSLTWAIMS